MRGFDLSGKHYGRLTVVGISDQRSPSGDIRWRCICDCGEETLSNSSDLRRGKAQSCGCLTRERQRAAVLKHGDCVGGVETVEYHTWTQMRYRCENPNFHAYELYGGRGISVCESWSIFENFLADMGRKPTPAHSIDRINNDGNYEPDNCRWATTTQQANNRRDGWAARRLNQRREEACKFAA